MSLDDWIPTTRIDDDSFDPDGVAKLQVNMSSLTEQVAYNIQGHPPKYETKPSVKDTQPRRR